LLPLALAAGLAVVWAAFFARYDIDVDRSMEPALHRFDRVITLKAQLMGPIRRGDIVVVTHDWSGLFISRVVGMGGDSVRITEGRLFRNGEEVTVSGNASAVSGKAIDFPIAPEALPTDLLRWEYRSAYGDTLRGQDSFRVPDGTVFLLNDNRSESLDSRIFGPVELGYVKGRLVVRCPEGNCWAARVWRRGLE
jgi:signal peptidase I